MKHYKMDFNFIRRTSQHLFVLSEPIKGRFIRIDSMPMPFVDMRNYIDKVVENDRNDNQITVEIITAPNDHACPSCGHKSVSGGLFLHDTRDNTTAFTPQYCDRCLLNYYFIIKMTSTTAKGE